MLIWDIMTHMLRGCNMGRGLIESINDPPVSANGSIKHIAFKMWDSISGKSKFVWWISFNNKVILYNGICASRMPIQATISKASQKSDGNFACFRYQRIP